MSNYKITLDDVSKVKAFVTAANKCPVDIYISTGRYIIDGKSIMGIFSLDLSQELDLSIESENPAVVRKCEKMLKPYIVKEVQKCDKK